MAMKKFLGSPALDVATMMSKDGDGLYLDRLALDHPGFFAGLVHPARHR
jgi:hypothetical protein